MTKAGGTILAAVSEKATRAGAIHEASLPHPVTVEGYTDPLGSQQYNLAPSENRARTVRDWLAAQGFLPGDTAIKGYGKLRPVAPNTFPDGRDNPEGRRKNRRVDIAINTCG
jgi:outer membrane protein OmpA-like peptidoglycan-associated protein